MNDSVITCADACLDLEVESFQLSVTAGMVENTRDYERMSKAGIRLIHDEPTTVGGS